MYFLKRHETEFSFQSIGWWRNSLSFIQSLQNLSEPRSYNMKNCFHEKMSIFSNSSSYVYHLKNKNYKHNLLNCFLFNVTACNVMQYSYKAELGPLSFPASSPLPPAQLLPFQTAAFAEQLPSPQCLLQSQWPYHASLQEDSRIKQERRILQILQKS